MKQELADKLLSAAQAVVNDCADGGMHVDREILDDLKAVVREIHDDAVKEIERIQAEALERERTRGRRIKVRAGAFTASPHEWTMRTELLDAELVHEAGNGAGQHYVKTPGGSPLWVHDCYIEGV